MFEYDNFCVDNFREGIPFIPISDLEKKKYGDVVLEHPLQHNQDLKSRLDALYSGDQSKEDDLSQVFQDGPFDVIVDDGGHSMHQQIVSLRTLFRHVKPGGVYVIEDLLTSYFWFDGPWHDESLTGGITTIQYIDAVRNALHWPDTVKMLDDTAFNGVKELSSLVENIDCFAEICIFLRKTEPLNKEEGVNEKK